MIVGFFGSFFNRGKADDLSANLAGSDSSGSVVSPSSHGYEFDMFMDFFRFKKQCVYTGSIYDDFLNSFGGMQLRNGLFTVFRKEDIDKWNGIVADFASRFKGNTSVFGYNWLGMIFIYYTDPALDNMIHMLDVGDNAVYEIPCSFQEFIDEELWLNPDAVVQESFFEQWLASPAAISFKYGECVGYKVPLFLNGEEEIDNLEVSDMDVYWTLMTQLIEQKQQLMNGNQG